MLMIHVFDTVEQVVFIYCGILTAFIIIILMLVMMVFVTLCKLVLPSEACQISLIKRLVTAKSWVFSSKLAKLVLTSTVMSAA